jgi:predicted alpha-1,2-mannosidase
MMAMGIKPFSAGAQGQATPLSRRNFLKTSGLVAAASALGGGTASAAETDSQTSSAPATIGSSLVAFVNILQGTDSTSVFSRGNTLPIAAAPFGMAHWTIQTEAKTSWMFQPSARRTQGFRCTHQLSPWLDDYGHAVFMPFRGAVHGEPRSRASSYRPEDAVLTPYSLELFLLRYRARIELVPTERCCLLTADFDAPEPADQNNSIGLIIDVPNTSAPIKAIQGQHQIQFASTASGGGTPANFATYYVVQFPGPWEKLEQHSQSDSDGRQQQMVLVHFKPGLQLEARIGTSFISYEQALHNLTSEVGSTPRDALRTAAEAQWNKLLSRIEIEGATQQQARTFYSCLYRTMLFPRIFHEPVPGGSGVHHYSAFNGKVEPGVMYADHGYWDVYRAWYPLASILFPERLGEITEAWVNALHEGGWLPQFPAPGYRACMSGSLIDSVMADSIVKGIGTFDREAAYAGLKKHATEAGDPDKGYGRTGIEQYLKLHYVPADVIEQSVAETADAAYGDFCIAQVAKVLGKAQEHQAFMARSAYWRNVYDPGVGFFRGKNADGSWLTPFDAFTWGSPYEEGAAWQHRWDAPHALPELFEAIGGKAAAVQALEAMVSTPPIFHTGVYGQEIHEMSEMAAVPFGQYAHSNQPSHHLLYLFAHAGRPDRTQFWVRRTLNELYSPDSFAGDEDTGSMAAWYILSSLGLYQVCPGLPEYTFGSPLFSKATVQLAGGKTLVVEAPDNSATNVFVRSVAFHGQTRSGITIEHTELVRGGKLTFQMMQHI